MGKNKPAQKNSGYSLIEMAMVLAIMAVLFTLGMGIWKGIHHFIRLQQIQSQFEDLTAELEVSAQNSEKLLACLAPKKHQQYFLVFSDYYLKEFPCPCFYDKDLSPVEDDYPLLANREKIAWALITPGPDHNYQFGYNWANQLTIPDPRQKTDLFPFDGLFKNNFDDQTFLPPYQRLRVKQGCRQYPPAAIDYLVPQKRITTHQTVVYKIIYPAQYDLCVNARGLVKVFREPVHQLTLPLQYGINRIGFSLLKNDQPIYTRYDYVARADKDQLLPLPFNATSDSDNAPADITFAPALQNPDNAACIIDFDDGYYKYLPVCNYPLIKHCYAAKGEYQPAIFVAQGTDFYYNATRITLDGNEKPFIELDLDVEQVTARGDKKKLEYKISLHAQITDDNGPLFCRLYYNSKLLTETKNCKYLSFSGYSQNATVDTFKIAVDDKEGARVIKAFWAEGH